MSENSRKIQLIRDIAIKVNAPNIKIAVDILKKERPQLFRGMKIGLPYYPIKSQRDVEDLRNNMACGNYPLSMTDCEVVGINGDCGSNCPVLLRDECQYQDEMVEAYCDKQAIKG